MPDAAQFSTAHEAARLEVLASFDILDTPPEPGFDDIAMLASQICEAPMALVSLIGEGRQWFKARVGFDACETPLERSVCQQTLGDAIVQVVPDLTKDPRTRDNPSVTGDPHLRFYAGARLETKDGFILGTVCVSDTVPRPAGLNPPQTLALEALARQVMAQLELRKAADERDAAQRRAADRALSDKAAEFEALAENVSQLAWMAHPDGSIFWFNRRWYSYTGTDRAAMQGWGWRSVHPPDQVERVTREIAARWAAGEPWESVYYLRSATGEYRPFLTRVEPIRDEAGDLIRWFGTNTDISAQIEAEAGLRDLTHTLEQRVAERTQERDRIWQVSKDMLGVADRDGLWLSVSPAWTRALQWPADSFLGRTLDWLVHPDDRARAQAYRQSAMAGETVTFEGRYRTKSDQYRLLSWVSVPSEGRIYSVGRDITAEREREAAFQDTLDFARLALSSVGGVGVWTYDVGSDRFFCDAAIANLYGIDPVQGAAGISRADFLANVHPDDMATLRATMAGGLARGGDLEFEYRIRHPDGSIRWVLSKGHTYIDESGTPIRRTGVGIEMTRQRQLEEQLRQAQKMEAVGQLTGGVAHDFNNLLTVIRSSVDLLKRPNLTDERRGRYIDAISTTTTRAAKLTGQLLAFARRQALKPEVFDVVESVKSIGDMVVTLTGARISVETSIPDGACFVNADASQFDTALVNIAVNARDAMQGKGTLSIAVGRASRIPALRAHPSIIGDFVTVSIGDTGSGIAPDHLDKIFEPFFTTKGVGHGTGLGLSQVFGFVKQSGGDVEVESDPGRGTTFRLYLPQVPPPRVAAGTTIAETSVDGFGTRVLVVEDNADVGSFATHTLEELGYQSMLAVDGPSALVELERDASRFDVVFSDVIMPGMSGIELGLEIRRRYADLPVVLTSGYSHVLAQSGSHGFELLHKPYSIEQLSRVLQKAAHLRRLRRLLDE
jgi:PAS domain S-box-containing protein